MADCIQAKEDAEAAADGLGGLLPVVQGAHEQSLNRAFNLDLRTNVVLIGDSITEGVDATEWKARYCNQFMQSLVNAADQGYRHFGNARIQKDFEDTRKNTDGTFISGGVVGQALQLLSGQSITLTNYTAQLFDVMYDADQSTGGLELYVNGILAASHTCSGSGLQSSFPDLQLKQDTNEVDQVEIKSTGTVIINSTSFLSRSFSGQSTLTGFVIPRSGWAFQNFNTPDQMDKITEYATFASSQSVVYIIALGTNNLYNPTYQVTPDEYITELEALVDGLNSRVQNASFLISVPPKAGSQWGTLPGYTYTQYTDKILDFCETNNYKPIRFDQIEFDNLGLTPDGIHPNDDGMAVMAQALCNTVNIKYNPNYYGEYKSMTRTSKSDFDYNGSWAALSSFKIKSIESQDGIVHVTGFGVPNGETNTIIGKIAPQHTPNRDIYTVVRTSDGLDTMTIKQNGDCQVGSIPW